MEDEVIYKVKGQKVRGKVYLTAQRLKDIGKQFSQMTEEEKHICLSRVEELAPNITIELYDALVQFVKKARE